MMEPRTDAETELRRWAMSTCVLAMLLIGVIVIMASRSVVRCHATLEPLPEPDGWRTWPVAPQDGGYGISVAVRTWNSKPIRETTRLDDDEVCPRAGIVLDDTSLDFLTQYERHREEIQIREKNGVFVVSGDGHALVEPRKNADAKAAPPPMENFLAAFRRRADSRFAWTSTASLVVVIGIGIALVGILASALLARHKFIRGCRYHDANRFKQGTLDPSGVIRFADGSAPIHVAPSESGRDEVVLVQLTGEGRGDYRTAPSTGAASIVPGTAGYLARLAFERASGHLRGAFLWSAVVILLSLVVADRFRLD
ncbi:hypothetical protein LZC95_09340 [Pendulispora brunnea]|uniref:RING-type E3 ubiquitin transferase n=1 Tax=Pendulispora brunnea TaxID=2905690 RepID=A0ABZ2KEB1_9BACT